MQNVYAHSSNNSNKKNDSNLFYLSNHLIKTIDLFDFIERETSTMLKWKDADHAKCCCPFPDHRDTNASFHIKRDQDGIIVYHCFGCGSSGTIIHFCANYFGLRNKCEAIRFLCNKFDIKNKEDLILAAIKNMSKRVDMQRKIESTNIVTSNQCRILLRKDFERNKEWVFNAYKSMNKAMEDEDYDTLEKIGYEASKKMREK
jgi:hypothetical protein